MKFYLAPLEGITQYVYRNAYNQHFEPMDKYFTPFISTNQQTHFTTRDLKEISPENNQGLKVIPQILSNKAEEFLKTAEAIESYGYKEVNLNLGCPSNTVVAKNKGSGFLFHQEALNKFLEAIFSKSNLKISIKTRHGKYEHDEMYELVKIYNQYPIEELIIHPRVAKDMYKNNVNLEVFAKIFDEVKAPICYNGDIFSLDDFNKIQSLFPKLQNVMLGRGVIANPGLVGLIKHGTAADKATIKQFHDAIYHHYQQILFGDRPVLFKMKELWVYMIGLFSDAQKPFKKIKKSEHLVDYDKIIHDLFTSYELSDAKHLVNQFKTSL